MELNPERKRQRRYEKGNREKERERKRRWRASLAQPSPSHGKTRLEIHALLLAQGGKCAICKCTTSRGRGWHGDHDHKTGTFRGVLCAQCNLGLGHFKDMASRLYRAIDYLEAHAHRRAQLETLL